jgi:tRNA(fMet)-specific endonuclease VapC
MRYLLDSNVCIAAMRGNPHVIARLQAVSASECVISTITSFELFTGVEKCSKPADERAKVQLLLDLVAQLGFETSAAREAAAIRASLESHGQTIGPYDLLLAGQAVAAKLILVTNNTKEFGRISALRIEDWHIAPS